MKNTDTYQVFIASPSDVNKEREIIRKVCENLNKNEFIKHGNISLNPIGWEDLPPFAGNPQDIINYLQKNCDIFICIFHKKYGTSTKKFDSGTYEEFFNAYNDWKIFKKPKIMFYFKNIMAMSLHDLKDLELKKVLELKNKITTDKLLLYKEFQTSGNFKEIIEKHLTEIIIQLTKEKKSKKENKKFDNNIVNTEKNNIKAVIPEIYKSFINDITGLMDIDYLRKDNRVITVKLPEVFQPLFSDDPDLKLNLKPEQIQKDKESILKENREPIEIEAIAARGKSLLISGMAGSGKTTLAKYITRTIINNQSSYFEKNLLPILIYCKDINKFQYQGLSSNAKSGEKLISWYCNEALSYFLDIDIILSFCKQGKAVFILDGLDEAKTEIREFLVSCFADFRHKYSKIKIILLGRPHCIKGELEKRFANRFVQVHDLTNSQALNFILKWFKHVYVGDTSYTGKDLAKKMISEISSKNDIDDLKNNPLMLTAMCILYNDSKMLPDQRADLYDRFVQRLFSKFEHNKIKINNFMMELAYSMFKEQDRGIDKFDAVKLVKKHFSLNDNIKTNTKFKTFEELFDEIEPATGLLYIENNRYKFIHLTFQEFLTACYFVNTMTESYFDTISKYINNKRYQEVVKLFIGLLSVRNSNAACNNIVKKILKLDPVKSVYNFIVAGESFLDIHKDCRNNDVYDLVIDRMKTLIRSNYEPLVHFKAGQIMGRLGYEQGYDDFITIPGGQYDLERLGKIEIKDFEISKFPVTNLWYKKFINDNGYKNMEFWTKQGIKWLKQNKITEPKYWRERKYNCPNSPVVGVSWYEANAFVKWLEKIDNKGFLYSVPTEFQWQAVAAGKEKRKYPWGNKEISPKKCNYDNTKFDAPSSVDIFIKGKTKQGIYDLAGNVWEWTSTDYYNEKNHEDFFYDPEMSRDINNYFPVVHGGSFFFNSFNCRCADRFYFNPGIRYNYLGFRCARIKL